MSCESLKQSTKSRPPLVKYCPRTFCACQVYLRPQSDTLYMLSILCLVQRNIGIYMCSDAIQLRQRSNEILLRPT